MATADKSTSDHIQELWQLLKDYAQQETVDPLKSLGRFLGFGIGATLVGGLGVSMLMLGLLRVLQQETRPHLTGSLTWVPYVVTLVISVVLIVLAGLAITRKSKGAH